MKSLNVQQKERLQKLIKRCAVLLVMGVLYFIFIKATGWGIPCIINLITNKHCPGCGISRMFVSLAGGDIVSAAQNNLLVLILLPFSLAFGIRRGVLYVKSGKSSSDKTEMIFLITTFVLMVVFWIMRNLSSFYWLAPIPY